MPISFFDQVSFSRWTQLDLSFCKPFSVALSWILRHFSRLQVKQSLHAGLQIRIHIIDWCIEYVLRRINAISMYWYVDGESFWQSDKFFDRWKCFNERKLNEPKSIRVLLIYVQRSIDGGQVQRYDLKFQTSFLNETSSGPKEQLLWLLENELSALDIFWLDGSSCRENLFLLFSILKRL